MSCGSYDDMRDGSTDGEEERSANSDCRDNAEDSEDQGSAHSDDELGDSRVDYDSECISVCRMESEEAGFTDNEKDSSVVGWDLAGDVRSTAKELDTDKAESDAELTESGSYQCTSAGDDDVCSEEEARRTTPIMRQIGLVCDRLKQLLFDHYCGRWAT
jgi:hypothetical protein